MSKPSLNENQLRKYNVPKQTVEFRRPNYGKAITDGLTTVEVHPELLDMVSEMDPLSDLIIPMHKFYLITKTEAPKWARRGKLIEYGWGSFKSILVMDIVQPLFMSGVAPRKEENLSALKNAIREYAQSRGFISGFTRVDRRFIAWGDDRLFPFDTALVLGMEMDKELLEKVPTPGERLCDFEIYVKSGERVFDVARFIRGKGYRCFARVSFDGRVKYPPHAVTAGLGELGAQGVVITRQYGPRQRWCMISIDADIIPDEPVDLGMAAYCDACRICIRACPGGAIPEERLWWRGVKKRKINDAKCYPFFKKLEGCGICLKVCPINRFGYEDCISAFRRDGTILGKTAVHVV